VLASATTGDAGARPSRRHHGRKRDKSSPRVRSYRQAPPHARVRHCGLRPAEHLNHLAVRLLVVAVRSLRHGRLDCRPAFRGVLRDHGHRNRVVLPPARHARAWQRAGNRRTPAGGISRAPVHRGPIAARSRQRVTLGFAVMLGLGLVLMLSAAAVQQVPFFRMQRQAFDPDAPIPAGADSVG